MEKINILIDLRNSEGNERYLVKVFESDTLLVDQAFKSIDEIKIDLINPKLWSLKIPNYMILKLKF